MSLLMKPTAMVLRRRMPWARGSGLKPRVAMAAWTFSRVARRTVAGALSERETVPTETPAVRATSRIVAGLAAPLDIGDGSSRRDPRPTARREAQAPSPLFPHGFMPFRPLL